MENNIGKYREFRVFGTEFVNHKLIDFISKDYAKETVLHSGKVLGMLEGKKTIAVDKEDDTQYIFDFALHEPKIEGKNAIQLYKEKVGAQNEMEEKFIAALENSYTSLFRVINTSPAKGLVFLKDALGRGKNIRLTDLGMSQMGNIDFLIFTRILPFEEMNITSGMGCCFSGSIEAKLTRKYEEHMRLKPDYNQSANKFIFFYEAFKKIGMGMEQQEV